MNIITRDLWNVKNLEPPPINSAKADIKEVDIKLLSNVLNDAVEFFTNQPHLCTEAAVLSRTVYRFKMKFRSSKDFKAMEKLSRALRAYLEVEMSKILKTFLDSVPKVYKANETYLPTKHMMDFVLVRMQGLGKVLTRILETCNILCQLCQQRLGLGHFWKIALIIYGMAARIFVIVKEVKKYTCELYSNLVPYSSKLSNSGRQWLPDGYVLPENLSDWLEIDWIDLETTNVEIGDGKPESEMFFNLIDDSDDEIEFYDEYILVKDEPSFYRWRKPVKEETVELSDDDVDIGEVINLSDVETPQVSNKENLGSNNRTLHGFDSNVDIGEVINLSLSTPELRNPRKRKRGKSVLSDAPIEIINLSKMETPRLKRPTKRKRLRSETSGQDVIEINDSPQSKIRKKKKVQNARSTEVIEITDSFNDEIINLSDIETPKASPIKISKKKKPKKKTEFLSVEPGSKVEHLNPNKKRKEMKGSDDTSLLQTSAQNVKKKKKKNGIVTHTGETNLTKSKDQNVTLKITKIKKTPALLNTRKIENKKKCTLNNNQSLNSGKKKHKKRKQQQM